MSCVIEGFYVRFFWDWLAFISGAFRWKVFAVFADDVGETSSLSPHAALLTPCPIAINAALDTIVNIRRGLMNSRQISSMEPLLFPFFSNPVDGSIKLIRPSVIMRTSSTLSRALLNHPTDISSGTSITTVCRCCMHCSAAFSTHGLILLYGGLFQIAPWLYEYCRKRGLYPDAESYPWKSNAHYWLVTNLYQNMRANALTDAELRRKAADELTCMTARINRGETIPEPVKQLPVMGGRPLNRAQALAKIAEIKAKFGLKGASV